MELRDYLKILKKRWVLIAVVTALTVGAVLVFMQKPVYEAQATCMVSASSTGQDQYSAIQVIEQLLQTLNKIAVSRPVLVEASNRLGHGSSANQLEGVVNSGIITNTQLIVISAQDTKPKKAMLEANAVADSLVSFVNQKAGENGTYKIEMVESALRDGCLFPKKSASPCGMALGRDQFEDYQRSGGRNHLGSLENSTGDQVRVGS